MVDYVPGAPSKDLDINSKPSSEVAFSSYVAGAGKKGSIDQKQVPELSASLDKFVKKLKGKFGKFLASVGVIPNSDELKVLFKEVLEQEGIKDDGVDDKVNVFVIIEDSSREKMNSKEMKARVASIVVEEAKKANKSLNAVPFLASEIWQRSLFGNYELNQVVAGSVPVFDLGIMAGIRVAEVHKNMVVQELSRYITSYVLAGSLIQGKATEESDVDVFVVIDDTDVTEMSNVELKAKLRQLILTLGAEAGRVAGVVNKLNVQSYILTDFWDSAKDANPVIFTFLRDGVPIYDRGVFMPWTRLLKTGRVKPSREAIESYKQFGERGVQTAKSRLKEIGMEDLFWALLTPSQAALMMTGITPTTPKETPTFMRDVFVKNKLLEESYVEILEGVINLRKSLEHGEKSDVSAAELDKHISGSEKYLKRLEKLYEEIDTKKDKETFEECYNSALDLMKEILRIENVKDVKHVEKSFESEIINAGKLPDNVLDSFNELSDAKKSQDNK